MGLFSSILGAFGANKAGSILYNAGTTGQKNIENQIASGQQGIQTGEQGVTNAVGNANTNVNAAVGLATGGVNAATGQANNTLASTNTAEQGNLNPYLNAGAQGTNQLASYAASNPQFNFAPTQQQLENTPGYQFQLQQGQNAITNQSAAAGLNQSGAALKELTQFGQGLAGTEYQNAFNNAQETFQTNQNATLANLSTLAGIGQTATGQSNAAAQNAGNQIASNTVGAGVYGGNANINASQYLGSLGLQGAGENLQGQENSANLGVEGEEAATSSLLYGAKGKALGTLGMYNGIGNALNTGADALFPASSLF